MPKKPPNARQKQVRTRYRTSASAARARQQRRRRGIMTGGGAVAIVLALLGLILIPTLGNGKTSTTTTSSSSTSSTTVAKSVAGKPCVATTGALPKGAPAVPVEVGPPPKTLVTKDLKVGTGAVVKAGATLDVDYIGVACSTGKVFDSSYASGKPVSFPLGQVIKGWQQGLPGMHVGGERLLGIPPALGYGDQGGGADIAPGETLWFVVHVLTAK